MDEKYFGFTAKLWYDAYNKIGMKVFEDKNLTDVNIIQLLGRCCIGKEWITPVIKKADWSIDRFFKAEKDYGLDSDYLSLVLGEYVIMDKMDYKNMTPFEIRDNINSNYKHNDLLEIGKKELKKYT